MAVSYKKLFKLLIDRDMKKKDFKELTGISQGTLNKLQNGGNVMVDVLEKICLNMDCNVEDIMEIYPDPVDSTKKRTARSSRHLSRETEAWHLFTGWYLEPVGTEQGIDPKTRNLGGTGA